MDSGNLAQKAVLPLLAELNKSGATGSLKLERAPLQKAVYFRDGQILFAASNDPKDQLASILVEEGKLGPDQMQIAQARVSAGNPLAKVLTELGYISQRELADAARLKVEKILTDLFGWKEGNYTFAEKSLPKGAIDLELSTPRLLFNSIRRMQGREWVLDELGSLDVVLTPENELDRFITDTEPDEQSGEVLRLVDGVKTVKQIGTLSSLGEFEVCKIVAAAHLLGALKKGEAVGTPMNAKPDDDEPLSLPVTESPLEPGPVISPPPVEEPEPYEHTIIDTNAKPFSEAESDLSSPSPSFPEESPPPPPAIMGSEASNLLIDEPEEDVEPLSVRQPPRPRRMKGDEGGSSGSMKKILMAAAGLVVVIGGGLAGYYFLWPMFAPSDTGTTIPPSNQAPISPKQPPASLPGQGNATASGGPATSGQPAQGAPGTTPTTQQQARPGGGPLGPPTTAQKGPPSQPTGAARTPTTPVTQSPTTTPPPQSTGAPPSTSSQRPAAPTTSTPRPPTKKPATTTPPAQTPSKGTSPPSKASQASPGGSSSQDFMRTGRFPQAAAANLQRLRNTAADKFTIAVGVYCDASNVARAYQNSGNSDQLIILPYSYRGRSCYRVFWGVFDTQAIAERNYASVPTAIRAPDSIPVPVSKLIN